MPKQTVIGCGIREGTNTVIPLQVDANGYLMVDLTNVDLGDLGDVNLAGIVNGDGIWWNAAAGEWQVAAPPAFACANLNACGLNDLGDVTIVGAARGDILRRGAAAWNNYAIGALNTVLTSNGVDPVWSAAPRVSFTELLGREGKRVAAVATWEDWDISAIIPAGGLAALIGVGKYSGVYSNFRAGVRKNGSALNRYGYFPTISVNHAASWAGTLIVELDASRIIEIFADETTYTRFSVLGYWS